MKKFLIFITLLAGYNSISAQTYGGLTINNANNPCGVFVDMVATDPSSSIPICKAVSKTVFVPAGSVYSWCTVLDFQGPFSCGSGTSSSVGWLTIAGIPSTSTQFNWTDVNFQFECPAWAIAAGYTDAGGQMSTPATTYPSGTCYVMSSSWTGSGSMPLYGFFTIPASSMPGGAYGDYVTVTFN